jgi:uncharacterized secreted protein with C-terminal beta-propeller domain
MNFIMQNLAFTFITIVAIGVTTVFVVKLVREINWNKMLKMKHQQMRVKTPVKQVGKRISYLAMGAISPIVVIALVLTVGLTAPSSPTGDLVTFNDGNDILSLYSEFQTNYEKLYNRSVNDLFLFGPEMAQDDIEADYGSGDPTSDQGSDDYSDTNVQVEGVDEMDNVVTDGKYIYSINNNRIEITLAYTQSLQADALAHYDTLLFVDEDTMCPDGFYANGLYVDEDYLVVIGTHYETYCDTTPGDDPVYEDYFYDYWYGSYNQNVEVYVYDKNDDFSLETTYQVNGNLIGTRKINDDLYIVTSQYIPMYQEDINIDDYLPNYSVNGMTVNAKYEDILYIEGVNPNSFTSFYALDLDHELVDMEVLLGDSGYNLYVSNDNIYLVGTIYNYMLDYDLVLVDEDTESKTAIIKVAINGASVAYQEYGIVKGHTLNQFSMDEHNGYLRIATTTGFGWWGTDDTNNRVFVLDEELNVVSSIENLGKPRETIKSVRFVGDFAYLVTFEQTDPFYVLDMSNPLDPVVLGELEITGFSSYLQPLGENFMLGIGFGDTSGGTSGIKISVYDVRDKTNPVVFDEVIYDYSEFGYSYSSVTYNHKDLLVSLSKGIIALPFTSYSYEEESYNYNSGILVFNFDETDGLSVRGYVQHDQNTEEEVYVYKSKFIDEYFYTISNKYVKVSTLADPTNIINTAAFPE